MAFDRRRRRTHGHVLKCLGDGLEEGSSKHKSWRSLSAAWYTHMLHTLNICSSVIPRQSPLLALEMLRREEERFEFMVPVEK